MARLTLTDARNLMLKGRPWTFRMECLGPNPNVQAGWSAKFWLATGRAQHEPVEIHYGVIGGTNPTIIVKDWAYVEAKAPEKEAKGYIYADTPFVKVLPSTIAGASQPSPLSTPPPPVAPAKPVPAPVATAPVKPAPIVGTVPTLPGPWGRIVAVMKQNGNWVGLDQTGAKVLTMTRDGARNLVRDHHHIKVVGL